MVTQRHGIVAKKQGHDAPDTAGGRSGWDAPMQTNTLSVIAIPSIARVPGRGGNHWPAGTPQHCARVRFGQASQRSPFYAMRFVHGDSRKQAAGRLHKAADGRGLSEGPAAVEFRKLLGCFISVCNAIEYAHSRGIVHRDMKPSNIMLGKYGETLVVDWGLAKPIDRFGLSRGPGN